MALNTAHHNHGVLIFSGERILLYCDTVEIKFEEIHNDVRFRGCKKGRLYLTTHRMIFNNNDMNDSIKSFTFPFFLLSDVGLEQPAFGCNYIKGNVKGQRNSVDLHFDGWDGTAKFKIYFRKGGAIDFGMALLQAAKMASQHANREPPPPYVPPIEPFCQAPHNMYMPPQGTYGMVLPTHVFPDYPPSNSVWMTDQPPPYPGLNTNQPPGYSNYPTASLPHINAPYGNQHAMCAGGEPLPNNPAAAAKASEAARQAAAQPAYYNPNNPHTAYMPPQPPMGPYGAQGFGMAQVPPYQNASAPQENTSYPNSQPPSYDEATKKSQ